MYVDWTRNLKTDEDKKNFLSHVISAKPVLDRLRDLIEERVNAVEIQECSVKDFDTPAWAEKQAFRNGFKAFARIIDKLIDLDSQRDKNVRPTEHFIGE